MEFAEQLKIDVPDGCVASELREAVMLTYLDWQQKLATGQPAHSFHAIPAASSSSPTTGAAASSSISSSPTTGASPLPSLISKPPLQAPPFPSLISKPPLPDSPLPSLICEPHLFPASSAPLHLFLKPTRNQHAKNLTPHEQNLVTHTKPEPKLKPTCDQPETKLTPS